MKDRRTIIIAGAGGIAEAVALLLGVWSPEPLNLLIGNRTLERARRVVDNVLEAGLRKGSSVDAFHLPEDESAYPDTWGDLFPAGSVLLDCLPGKEAPRMARLALRYDLHYANLTEHVRETEEIMQLAAETDKGMVLQTGLAPGFIGVLAHGLVRRFCERYAVEQIGTVAMRVGALTEHAFPPAYYGFTWSPAGVATEYVEPAVVIRDFTKMSVPSLSERELIRINGMVLEADLTSGGAADLPDALQGKVGRLDYKTLRYPGHYDWVEQQLAALNHAGEPSIERLQHTMENIIPRVEDDLVVIYAAVEGMDHEGTLRRMERSYWIRPQQVGNRRLRAIQTTTAAPLAEIGLQLAAGKYKGLVLQSQLDPETFLNGPIVREVYGAFE